MYGGVIKWWQDTPELDSTSTGAFRLQHKFSGYLHQLGVQDRFSKTAFF